MQSVPCLREALKLNAALENKITMNLADLKDKAISMIIWNTGKEDDVRVYLGKLQIENSGHYFVNEEKGWRVSLDKEQLSRLKPVSSE